MEIGPVLGTPENNSFPEKAHPKALTPTYGKSIPLYSLDNHLVAFLGEDDVTRLGQSIHVKRSRRGHIREGKLRGLSCQAIPTLEGGSKQSFEQPLSSGRVWALKGVRGSR